MLKKVGKYRSLETTPRVALANFYPFRQGEVVGPQWSPSDLFLPVLRGTGEIWIAGQAHAMRAGQIAHVPWAAPVRYRADARDPFLVIGIHLVYQPWHAPIVGKPAHSFVSADGAKAAYELPPVPTPFPDAFIIDAEPDVPLIRQAHEIVLCFENAAANTLDREAELRARADLFLREAHRMRASVTSAAAHPQAGLIKMLETWIESNYAQPIKRPDLAARVRMSESLLSQAFRAVLGKTPIDHLIDVRLKHARRLLRESHLPIGDIAKEVGIEDVYYFSKLFKKRLGMSPRRYRDRFKF
jgi:AraC-like DNA-binding protein